MTVNDIFNTQSSKEPTPSSSLNNNGEVEDSKQYFSTTPDAVDDVSNKSGVNSKEFRTPKQQVGSQNTSAYNSSTTADVFSKSGDMSSTNDYDSSSIDYELLSHKELERLREENARLRENPFKGRAQPHDLQGSVDRLTEAINKLTRLFSSTNEEMLVDYKRGTLQEHIKQISSQNEKIAEGMLTLADMFQKGLHAQAPPVNYPQSDYDQLNTSESLQQNMPSDAVNSIPSFDEFSNQNMANVNNTNNMNNVPNEGYDFTNQSFNPNPSTNNSLNTPPNFENGPINSETGMVNEAPAFNTPQNMPFPTTNNSMPPPPPPPPEYKKKGLFGR